MKLKLLSSIAATALLMSFGSAYAQPSEAGPGDQETGPGNQEGGEGNQNTNSNNDSSDNSDNSTNDSNNTDADVDAFTGDDSDVLDAGAPPA